MGGDKSTQYEELQLDRIKMTENILPCNLTVKRYFFLKLTENDNCKCYAGMSMTQNDWKHLFGHLDSVILTSLLNTAREILEQY